MPLQVRLITTCFKHKLEIRNLEFKHCFIKNINNKFISQIIVFFEGYDHTLPELEEFNYMQDDKVKTIDNNSFPDYSILFDYANSNYKDEIVIVANADIYYDETLALLDCLKLEKDTMLFLTRYNTKNDNGFDKVRLQNPGSFDSFIFRSPIKPFAKNIMMGALGCDSYLLQRAREAHIKVFNPALSIKSWHHHNKGGSSESRNGFRYWNQPYYKGKELSYCTIEEVRKTEL